MAKTKKLEMGVYASKDGGSVVVVAIAASVNVSRRNYWVRRILPRILPGAWMTASEIQRQWPLRVTKCVVE